MRSVSRRWSSLATATASAATFAESCRIQPAGQVFGGRGQSGHCEKGKGVSLGIWRRLRAGTRNDRLDELRQLATTHLQTPLRHHKPFIQPTPVSLSENDQTESGAPEQARPPSRHAPTQPTLSPNIPLSPGQLPLLYKRSSLPFPYRVLSALDVELPFTERR